SCVRSLFVSTTTNGSSARNKGTLGRDPRSWLGLRSVLSFIRHPLTFLQQAHERYGDFVRVPMLGQPWAFLFHPDDVESLLVAHHADLARDDYSHQLKRVLGEGL